MHKSFFLNHAIICKKYLSTIHDSYTLHIFIFYSILFVYFLVLAVFSTKKGMKHVWKGHAADSEIRNISARQDAFSRWTATDNRSKRKVAV